MNKRKFEEDQIEETRDVVTVKKNSLDSDEEDETEDVYNLLDVNLLPDEQENVPDEDYDVRKTAFNMKEEMEEGHFDRDGHFIWKKENELRDNWLDNIDWHQIKKKSSLFKGDSMKGLGDESSDEDVVKFNEIECYKNIIRYMQPKENITKALQRLGGENKKLSSVERLKLKKTGKLSKNSEDVVKLTEFANTLLNHTGNMDVYQETYEKINCKIAISKVPTNIKRQADTLDMYADDFDEKEKLRLDEPGTSSKTQEDTNEDKPLMWEYKLNSESEVSGLYTSQQMLNWLNEKKFESNSLVRKYGQEQFYSISRIDFELYIS